MSIKMEFQPFEFIIGGDKKKQALLQSKGTDSESIAKAIGGIYVKLGKLYRYSLADVEAVIAVLAREGILHKFVGEDLEYKEVTGESGPWNADGLTNQIAQKYRYKYLRMNWWKMVNQAGFRPFSKYGIYPSKFEFHDIRLVAIELAFVWIIWNWAYFQYEKNPPKGNFNQSIFERVPQPLYQMDRSEEKKEERVYLWDCPVCGMKYEPAPNVTRTPTMYKQYIEWLTAHGSSEFHNYLGEPKPKSKSKKKQSK